jgi:hypothetical protein
MRKACSTQGKCEISVAKCKEGPPECDSDASDRGLRSRASGHVSVAACHPPDAQLSVMLP